MAHGVQIYIHCTTAYGQMWGKTIYTSVEALKVSVTNTWQKMTADYMRPLCSEFRGSLEAIIAAKGGLIEKKISLFLPFVIYPSLVNMYFCLRYVSWNCFAITVCHLFWCTLYLSSYLAIYLAVYLAIYLCIIHGEKWTKYGCS